MQNNADTALPPSPSEKRYVPKTPFGKKMATLRAEIIASGKPLLDAEGIAREVAERREGVRETEL